MQINGRAHTQHVLSEGDACYRCPVRELYMARRRKMSCVWFLIIILSLNALKLWDLTVITNRQSTLSGTPSRWIIHVIYIIIYTYYLLSSISSRAYCDFVIYMFRFFDGMTRAVSPILYYCHMNHLNDPAL